MAPFLRASELLILAHVMISQFVGLSPATGSALTVWILLEILCLPLSLSAPPPWVLTRTRALSLSQNKQISKLKINKAVKGHFTSIGC